MTDGYMKTGKVVATFVDEYGEERIIHRRHGKRLSVKREGNTPAHAFNRIACELMGKRIKQWRLNRGFTLSQLCTRAGLATTTPKARMREIETAQRQTGIKLGTLYALAAALDVPIHFLLPSTEEVREMAGVKEVKTFEIVL